MNSFPVVQDLGAVEQDLSAIEQDLGAVVLGAVEQDVSTMTIHEFFAKQLAKCEKSDTSSLALLREASSLGMSYVPASGKPYKRPTITAPWFPKIHLPTFFRTFVDLLTIATIIDEILKENEVSFRDVASEGAWYCEDQQSFCTFVVRVYRIPGETNPTQFAIEMNRTEGFSSCFTKFFNELKSRLTPGAPVSKEEQTAGASETSSSVATADIEAIFTENPSAPRLTTKHLKQVIIGVLESGDSKQLTDICKLASSIYADMELLITQGITQTPPDEFDREIIKLLVGIVCRSKNNADRDSKLAFWALSSMTFNKDFCATILEGDRSEFLEKMMSFSLKKEPLEFAATKRCIIFLRNMIKFDEAAISKALDAKRVRDLMESIGDDA